MSKKKKNLILIVACIVFIIIVFCVTYFIKNEQLNNKIDELSDMTNYVTELDEFVVKSVDCYYKGEKYTNLNDLKGVVKSGDIVQCTVTYDNDKTKIKKAYVSINTDTKETNVLYEDKEDFGQILLPVEK